MTSAAFKVLLISLISVLCIPGPSPTIPSCPPKCPAVTSHHRLSSAIFYHPPRLVGTPNSHCRQCSELSGPCVLYTIDGRGQREVGREALRAPEGHCGVFLLHFFRRYRHFQFTISSRKISKNSINSAKSQFP